MKREELVRKVRSDKKIAIAPFISDHERVWIYRIASKCNCSAGEVGLQLVQIALQDEQAIAFFSTYMKRDYRFKDNHWYCGHDDAKSIYDYLSFYGDRSRFKIKVSQTLAAQLREFQISLGLSYLSHATYAVLRYALHDIKTVQLLVPGITKEDFTEPIRPAAISQPSNVWSIFK